MLIRTDEHPPITQKSQVGRHGCLQLRFGYHNPYTTMPQSYSRPPLQVMRAIPDASGCLCIYMLSPTGGVVQRDHYDINIVLEAGAHALVTTIAATKVYKMPDAYAAQTINIEVQEGAILEYIPDALILFRDADLRQTLNVTLHPGALCILQDIVMGGRAARNEHLEFRRFQNRIQVEDEQGLLLLDSVDYAPQSGDLHQIGLLDGYICWASWYLLGDLMQWGISAAEFCQMHHEIKSPYATGSLSTLYRNGLTARMVSQRLDVIDQTFERLRFTFRQAIQRPYSHLRK